MRVTFCEAQPAAHHLTRLLFWKKHIFWVSHQLFLFCSFSLHYTSHCAQEKETSTLSMRELRTHGVNSRAFCAHSGVWFGMYPAQERYSTLRPKLQKN